MRPIDADAVIEKINGEIEFHARLKDNTAVWASDIIKQIVEDEPTVDAVPVVHGHWDRDYLVSTNGCGYPVFRCSICEHTYQDIGYHFNYCPHCGALMDGERREE